MLRPSILFELFSREGFWFAINNFMFKAIGFLIILWGLSNYFSSSFNALDSAVTQGFKTFESAALLSQKRMNDLR
ncbi:hypothetical protein CO026_02100 [Candidatus Kaiserbacteria bacterium CG_4_9_14_0_2_um_filter_41_32]|uniref:Uncharacterized protein n=1 Tax=Candidatus Kaiserbacteria bacterium CG_4_9_14_0_2_um_filter_41_32 TaxID=1974601 RepID=A0A2M8FEN3_9BACT|nr:MAG: hypothetical protein CO026_02100 [Candidatus Kaiserbacteria bacterium CG_4_9_14_0_2_um_filter_41_32]